MMFFDAKRAYFTPYHSPVDLLVDLACIITDPLQSLFHVVKNLSSFLLWSAPLAIGLLAFNTPLLALLALPLLMINTPIIIALAVLTAPAIYYFSLTAYNLLDLILSPIIDALRVLTNVGATLIEGTANTMEYVFA